MIKQLIWFILCAFTLMGCANPTPGRPALSTAEVPRLSSLAKPDCGARIYAIMGVNQKYPTTEGTRIPRGDLFVDGQHVDTVTKNPEISVIDVPPGKVELSWMVTDYGQFDRDKTKQSPLILNLADREVAYVVLDFYNDTNDTFGLVSMLGSIAFRTEVVETRDASRFAGKKWYSTALYLKPFAE